MPVALEVASLAHRVAQAQENFGKAEQAYRQRDFDAALELLNQVDATAPNQAASYNLRGEILMAQGKEDEAEAALRNALVANPQLLNARYNLARIPFKKRDYETARKQLEAILGATSGGNQQRQREQLIRYQIFLTILLEGRDGPAQKALDEFKMMDDTPALYYAQAAWAFQHGDATRGNVWVANAGNLYPEDLNRAFAAPLADLGWVGQAEAGPTVKQAPTAAGATPAFRVAAVPRSESPDAQVLAANIPEMSDAPFDFTFAPATPSVETPTTFLPEADELPVAPTPEASATPEDDRDGKECRPAKGLCLLGKRRIANPGRIRTRIPARSNRASLRVEMVQPQASPTMPARSSTTPDTEAIERPHQNLGEKLARFLLCPFQRRKEPVAKSCACRKQRHPPRPSHPGQRIKLVILLWPQFDAHCHEDPNIRDHLRPPADLVRGPRRAAPKSELESIYDKAFREFDSEHYDEALKALDEIDARQPDLAESLNLRGVVLMRQGKFDKAEAALRKALSLEPRFWNASFNLAEIPFLKKDWVEARNRFEGLVAGQSDGMQPETSQLIQYKILLTFVRQGKENTVDWMLNKFEAAKDSPALYYSNAAIAFQHGNEKEAKDWLAAAKKQYPAPLNKLYAESFYEIGWMQKPAGESRAALEITSTAERAERMKADAKANFEKAERAFQQRDFAGAARLLDLAEAGSPNEPAFANLRGQILMEQKKFDEAEGVLRKATAADPKFREAQYNLAQVSFKKGEYAKSRERFENLFSETPGDEKNQASQLIKFKIFLTLLLEGKDPEAQQLMDQFKFTGDTPALYYAQAAWEFKHSHKEQGSDWVTSARKIYPPALNLIFADAFYDLGWLIYSETGSGLATSALALANASPGTEATPVMRLGQAESLPAPEYGAGGCDDSNRDSREQRNGAGDHSRCIGGRPAAIDSKTCRRCGGQTSPDCRRHVPSPRPPRLPFLRSKRATGRSRLLRSELITLRIPELFWLPDYYWQESCFSLG